LTPILLTSWSIFPSSFVGEEDARPDFPVPLHEGSLPPTLTSMAGRTRWRVICMSPNLLKAGFCVGPCLSACFAHPLIEHLSVFGQVHVDEVHYDDSSHIT
jgi:hypothetical protein